MLIFEHNQLQRSFDCFDSHFVTPGRPWQGWPKSYLEIAMADHLGLRLAFDPRASLMDNYEIGDCFLETNQRKDNISFFQHWAYTQCTAKTHFTWKPGGAAPEGFHRINRGLADFHPFHESLNCKGEHRPFDPPPDEIDRPHCGFLWAD